MWEKIVPVLQDNSKKRIAESKDYQLFLEEAKKLDFQQMVQDGFEGQDGGGNTKAAGRKDIQMGEATNIVKDMISFTVTDGQKNAIPSHVVISGKEDDRIND
jgi:hypothetical protein